METHFGGSRSHEGHVHPHQRQYDEQNPEIVNNMDHHDENEKDQLIKHPEDLDSDINTDYGKDSDGESLTNDEDASTDPNDVDDKPSFNGNNDDNRKDKP